MRTKANKLLAGGEKSVKISEDEESLMGGINKLPYELLINIISHLTLKEATVFSILCRRWRNLHLWTFTGRLDFDGTYSLFKLKIKHGNPVYVPMGEARSKFVKWVNRVIALRNDSVPLQDFKLVFYLSGAHEGYINEWVRYALEREVQTLELNLSSQGLRCFTTDGMNRYSIPCSFLQETFSSIHFRKLRRIWLEYVDVSGEALEFFLRNCPLLEGLSVCESTKLVTLKVVGPYPSLKLLEIRSCCMLKSVEIRDVNLVCLKYSGREVKFVVENAPLLVELFVGTCDNNLGHQFEIRYWMDCFLSQFGRILDQLEILNIRIHIPEDSLGISHLKFNLRNLKQLVVTLLPTRIFSLYPPNVNFVERMLGPRRGGGRMMEEKKKKLYEKLKKVECEGYGGEACELESVMHLVQNAPALQKITIHTNSIHVKDRVCMHQRLAPQMPHPIIFNIL